jgi:hypothetical protein
VALGLEVVSVIGEESHELTGRVAIRELAYRHDVGVGAMLEQHAKYGRVAGGLLQSCCGIAGIKGMVGEEL